MIGEIFDRVYTWASLDSAPVEAVQTVSVPAGGAAVVDLKLDVPGPTSWSTTRSRVSNAASPVSST